MSNLYITEYAGNYSSAAAVPLEPEVTTQVVAFTGTAGTSAALKNNTSLVRIQTDGICSVFFSIAGTAATTSNRRMTAGQTESFLVPTNKAYKISAITNT